MNAIFCIIAIAFALMGMLIRIGKGEHLMRGFIKNYDKKKKVYDRQMLQSFMSKIMYVCAISFALMVLGISINIKYIVWAGILVFLAIIFYTARYTENEENFTVKKELHE